MERSGIRESFAEPAFLRDGRPIRWEQPQTDVAMYRGPTPVQRSVDPTMLDRIVVNVVNVAGKIFLIPDEVFPEAPLP